MFFDPVDVPTIDLHSACDTFEGAHMAVEFVEKEYYQGTHVVGIVHGRGEGKMREAVLQALDHHRFVKRVESAVEPFSLGGKLFVYLV